MNYETICNRATNFMDYFTGDLHLRHKNIIKYSNRPFSSLEEMEEVLIENTNNLVAPEDRLFMHGDFCFGSFNKFAECRNKIHCKTIFYILGNHCHEVARKRSKYLELFHWIGDYKEITVDNQHIVMSHYPFLVWNKCHHGSWHTHAHCHGSLQDNPGARRWDVGVDNNNYKPVSFDELKEIMSKKEFRPIDHHNKHTN